MFETCPTRVLVFILFFIFIRSLIVFSFVRHAKLVLCNSYINFLFLKNLIQRYRYRHFDLFGFTILFFVIHDVNVHITCVVVVHCSEDASVTNTFYHLIFREINTVMSKFPFSYLEFMKRYFFPI